VIKWRSRRISFYFREPSFMTWAEVTVSRARHTGHRRWRVVISWARQSAWKTWPHGGSYVGRAPVNKVKHIVHGISSKIWLQCALTFVLI
jgi:hypothetical protein